MSIAAPAITEADQPMPRNVRPTVICTSEWPDVPAMKTASNKMDCPSRIVRSAPQRSLSTPMSGDSENMPAMCRLIVSPMTLRLEP